MKSMTYNCLLETLTYNTQYEGENGATQLSVDFTGGGVDAYTKHVAFATAEGVIYDESLGIELVETFDIPDTWTAHGRGQIQPYAVSGTTIVRFAIKPIRFQRSVLVS
jgi:hypothetical protein